MYWIPTIAGSLASATGFALLFAPQALLNDGFSTPLERLTAATVDMVYLRLQGKLLIAAGTFVLTFGVGFWSLLLSPLAALLGGALLSAFLRTALFQYGVTLGWIAAATGAVAFGLTLPID